MNSAPELAGRLAGVPVLLHPAEHVLWRLAHPDLAVPDTELADGGLLHVGGIALRVLHTPGHSPGSCCLYAADLGVLFSGDTTYRRSSRSPLQPG